MRVLSTGFVCLLAAALPLAAETTDGLWIGGSTVLGEPIFVEARIAGSTGELEVPSEEITVPIEGIEVTGEKVAFRVLTPYGIFGFEGARSGEIIRGQTISPGGDRRSMHLRRMPAPPDSSPYAGTYRSAAGDEMVVMARQNGQLRATGLSPLRSLRLVWLEADRFVDASSVIEDPERLRTASFTRRQNGGISGFEGSPRIDRYRLEDVTFRNEGVSLAGTLILPSGKGPFPAAVIVHGSGPVTRDQLLLRAQLLLRMGLAVLLYDKRGTGQSTGDWKLASFETLAADAAAGVRLLRSRAEIDQGRVGLVGHSQAGWIIPPAANLERVAFCVIASGGAISPVEQEVFRAEAQTRESARDVSKPKKLMTLAWDYARTGAGWQEYQIAWREAASEKWFSTVAGPASPDDPLWRQMRIYAAYDPGKHLGNFTTPTLVLLGKEDENLPAEAAASAWKRALKASGNAKSEVRVIDGTGHNLIVRQKNNDQVYSPEYVESMRRWLERQGVIGSRGR